MSQIPNIVKQVDDVILWITIIDVGLLALITFLMIFFVIKYHKSRHPKPEKVKEHPFLEIFWTVTPTILVIGMFFYGWAGYRTIRNVPKDAFVIKVIGRQWQWGFEYPNGKQSDIMYVPIQKPIKLLLHSNDVIHGFYIPAYRIKRDCVPGMENYLWFASTKLGSEDIFCTQYCGLYHSGMITKVTTLDSTDFDKWYNTKTQDTTASVQATSVSSSTTQMPEHHEHK